MNILLLIIVALSAAVNNGTLNVYSTPQKAPRSLVNYRGRGQTFVTKGLTMGLYENLKLDSSGVGRRFSKWTQLGPVFSTKEGRWRIYRAVCQCECGVVSAVNINGLNSGRSSRCERCRILEFRGKKHGLTGTAEYDVWSHMIDRCTNESSKGFKYYGGRGISVCKRWLDSVETFYADMGPRPAPGYEIDRRDNDGNYCPENCRWVSKLMNIRNRPMTRKFIYRGIEMTITELATISGIGRGTMAARLLHQNWSVEDAVNTPAIKGRNQYG